MHLGDILNSNTINRIFFRIEMVKIWMKSNYFNLMTKFGKFLCKGAISAKTTWTV